MGERKQQLVLMKMLRIKLQMMRKRQLKSFMNKNLKATTFIKIMLKNKAKIRKSSKRRMDTKPMIIER